MSVVPKQASDTLDLVRSCCLVSLPPSPRCSANSERTAYGVNGDSEDKHSAKLSAKVFLESAYEDDGGRLSYN